jgi:hypothetical protein
MDQTYQASCYHNPGAARAAGIGAISTFCLAERTEIPGIENHPTPRLM